jgi:hypothetical protein
LLRFAGEHEWRFEVGVQRDVSLLVAGINEKFLHQEQQC